MMLIVPLVAAALITAGFESIADEPPPAQFAPAAAAVFPDDQSLVGEWAGAVKLPGVELQIAVRLAFADGAWTGMIDIPQQGQRGLKLDQIAVSGEEVRFVIAGIPGAPTFVGKRDGAARITGDFTQGGMKFPFELTKGEIAKPKRPQTPIPPFPYTTEPVTAQNGDVKLSGTLTMPEGAGPFPVVILVSGSGPQNRDEEVFEHRPFAVWADFLGRNGIATVRYDDRGVGESTGDFGEATTSDFAADAEAWVGVLRARTQFNSIGILGHSEGGVVAPMVAARNPAVAFIVMLAGTGVSGAEVLAEQNRALTLASGATAEVADRIAAAARIAFAAIAAGEDDAAVREKVVELVKAQSGVQDVSPAINRTVDQAMAGLKRPWLRAFLAHDPAVDIQRVRVPVLALFGERDVQVVPSQNAPAVEAALKEAGNAHVTVRTVPGVNHLFQRCTSGTVDEYEKIETTVEPEVLQMVADWIRSNAGTAKSE